MSAALLMALALFQHEHHAAPAPPEPVAQANPHAGHDMSAMASVTTPPVPKDHAAERFYSPASMAAARAVLGAEHGGGRYSMALVDQAELRTRKGADVAAFEGEAWLGDDASRWVLKARGEHLSGAGWESAELQGLYARPIGPYFDLQAGLRADIEPKGRTYAALGVEGVAPYWIETKATAFLSDRGDLSARLEAAHDLRLTGRLILQPRVETNLAGDGQDAELGFRLRYAITQEFAPYVGLLRHRRFGDEAAQARTANGRTGESRVVFGIRAWF